MKETESTNSPNKTEKEKNSRREFLQKVGVGSILLSAGATGFQSVRALIPDVLYEASERFKVGHPTQLSEGVTFIEDRRLYVFKEGRSYYAISGACTHLGCTVKYTKLNQPKDIEVDGLTKKINFEFHCPCHGSKFYADGTNFAGPAPRPLRWYKLEQSPDDGQLIVDLGEEVEQNFRLTV
ncbi:MAG: ubiquinol-cytochrome c reductase iron-sulfur subunit [Bacteroidota bacterium]|nr:ubiquinol-cytochrome c reductase iron-sulfur subunit [Bacteroidota bacterium]